jgi:putative glutamine amidotransferase
MSATLSSGRRVRIGVTGPDRGGEAAWLFTAFSLALAGASAVRITPHRHADARIIDQIDGLIIGGGADVDPKLYGQELLHIVESPRVNQPLTRSIANFLLFPLIWGLRKASACCVQRTRDDVARDQLEMQLIERAIDRRIPILGICRGMQLINVCFGGSLHQSLKGFYTEDPEVRTILPRKRITAAPGTKLAKILGTRSKRVNALHEQAISELGNDLIVAAKDRNQIVQAIEHASLPFVIGVQWHPEYLPQLRSERRIFKALVRAARVSRKSQTARYKSQFTHKTEMPHLKIAS